MELKTRKINNLFKRAITVECIARQIYFPTIPERVLHGLEQGKVLKLFLFITILRNFLKGFQTTCQSEIKLLNKIISSDKAGLVIIFYKCQLVLLNFN